MSAPPIVVSSKTKKKLEGFQFVRGADLSKGKISGGIYTVEQDKENIGPGKDRFASSAAQRTPQSSLTSTQKSRQDGQREIPPTPVGRVPFAELIRNKDEVSEQRLNPSPGEQVYWHHSPHNSDLASLSATPLPRRGSKRARSSSPISSSQSQVSNHLPLPGYKSPLDLQTIQQSLKTPEADPVGDLWSRYSLNTTGERESPNSGARLYAFLSSSSPQTPVPNHDSGLRRSISCRTDWPTSASKRRKIQKSHSQVVGKSATGFFEETTNLPSGSVVSRVSMLVEQLYDGLPEPNLVLKDVEQPSCSPIPHTGKPMLSPHTSNLLQLETGTKSEVEPSILNENIEVKSDGRVSQPANVRGEECMIDKESNSEFGDDELDFDIFAQVDLVPKLNPGQSTQTGESMPAMVPRVDVTREGRHARNVQRVSLEPLQPNEVGKKQKDSGNQQNYIANNEVLRTAKSHVSHDDDEFDDDVFDEDCAGLFAPDLEKLAAIIDQQGAAKAKENVNVRNKGLPAENTRASGDAQKGGNNGGSSAKVDCVDASSSVSEDEFGGNDLDFAQVSASTGLGIEWPGWRCSSVRIMCNGLTR